jgi:hypothetical protein
MGVDDHQITEIPASNAPREAWVRWLVGGLASRWPQAKLRAAIEGMQPPGVRRGIVPDIEFWYPNDDGVYALRYLYIVMPTDRIGSREGLDTLTALVAYCRSNGRQLTLIVPDRPLQKEELEALDSVLLATINPMVFDVAAYQIE